MIKIRPSAARGRTKIDWLDGRHTFSFGGYHDPAHMGFGALRVINQDVILPGAGFPTHGHRDMEIVTYVLRGAVAHRDSMGNGSTIAPGDVQLMSAGTGVMHSEFNGADGEETELLQMWVIPARAATRPRYEQGSFARDGGQWRIVVSPDGADGSLTIGQNAHMYVFRGESGAAAELELDPARGSWMHVGAGAVHVITESGTGADLAAGDGAAIRGEKRVKVSVPAGATADVVLWTVPD